MPAPTELAGATQPVTSRPGPDVESEITWLLHRAAQRMRHATGQQAERRGLQLRDYIILSALDRTPNLTQIELGKALGLDKTTLMSQLDGLERRWLVVRRPDIRDRRARIPEITQAGNELRAYVASACADVEAAALEDFTDPQRTVFRHMLLSIIGDVDDPGSCL